MRCELLIGQVCPVLKRSMILAHVLLQSMLRQVYLAALIAGEGVLQRAGWCRFAHTGLVHGILSEHNAFVNPLGDDSA